MSLTIRDILVLDFFNGKSVTTRVPEFQTDLYGRDADARIHELCDEGWIRHSRPQETLNMLPDSALAGLLLARGISEGGTHAELVRRVTVEVPEAAYAHMVPKVYVATADGKLEMAHHMAYILNARGSYGFSDGEIGEAQKTLSGKADSFTANDILARAFQQKSALFVMAGEWTKLRNLYFTWGNFCLRARKNETALEKLCLVFFLDMSGMENHNTLVRYEKLFPTQKGIILLMDRLASELSLQDAAMRSFFLTTVARTAPRLPFSYFSPQVMAGQLLERLRGVEFSHAKYFQDRNTPDENASAYRWTAGPEPDYEKANSDGTNAFLIQRKRVPAVPPVLRLPRFTAPPPFIPPDQRKQTAPAPQKSTRAEAPESEEETGWKEKLRGLFSAIKKK